ncbi:hypothetical protein [uncultured Mediterranean phage uvMED]|nr:hypothetical protein [uncultured Mediterranean phage uvMED]
MHYSAAKIIDDQATHTGRFQCVKALEDTVIHTLVSENITGTKSAVTINSNCSIEGVITSIKLTSGSVIAYVL